MNVDLSFNELDEKINGRDAYGVKNELTDKPIGIIAFYPEIKEYCFSLTQKGSKMSADGMMAVSEVVEELNESLDSQIDEIDELLNDVSNEIDSLNESISKLNKIIDLLNID